jgi:hypothetical protein
MYGSTIRLLTVIVALIALPGAASAAAIVSFDLSAPAFANGSAAFDVGLSFSGDPTDTIEAIQLSVFGSDPLLTLNDTAFDRFSFAPSGATLPGWLELSPLSTGLGLYAPVDPIAGPFLAPSASPYHLGTLSVDVTGIAAGTPLLVTLSGGPPGLGTDVGGLVAGILVPSFAAADPAVATVSFTQPAGIVFPSPAVAEPGLMMLLTLGFVTSAALTRKRSQTRPANTKSTS